MVQNSEDARREREGERERGSQIERAKEPGRSHLAFYDPTSDALQCYFCNIPLGQAVIQVEGEDMTFTSERYGLEEDVGLEILL